MAINLGAMIQAARSQRNPSGEAISNALAGNEYKNKIIGEQTGIGNMADSTGGVGNSQMPVSLLTKILSSIGMFGA